MPMSIGSDPVKWLRKKAKAGMRGYPVGTVAFYGPDDRRATKVAAAILLLPDTEPAELRRFTNETSDLRDDRAVMKEVMALMQFYGVRTIVMPPGLLGCPHEEGKDYPSGSTCPHCPYWIGRDRFASLRGVPRF
jgi:hypothetical protein